MNLIVTPDDICKAKYNEAMAKLNRDKNEKIRQFMDEEQSKKGVVARIKPVGEQ